ncbi:MAG: O-acetyl-ADP-ribose deacetylase [Candidatus Kapaibacterium sp.]
MADTISDRIKLVLGDITHQSTDAIVNAANSSLLGGGGVDGAIHRAAGRELLEECRLLNGCDTGDAKITKGYNLKAKYVIHTVGPVWRGGNNNEENLLRSCYRKCFELAGQHNITTIAFPAISTGVYGYPLKPAAEIAVSETINFLKNNKSFQEVKFVCFDMNAYNVYQETEKGFTE